MKSTIPALLLAGALTLTGCSAMLDRPYVSVSSHPEHPGTGADTSTITVNSYPELVDALLYFVAQTQEEGSILLADYDGDVATDLSAACVEVAKDDPLGAYAVDFIQTSYTRVLTTYEAQVSIAYRRTPEQIRSLTSVTGSSAIRRVLGAALAEFKTEVALQIGYFAEDEAYIRRLVRQAYCDTPASAMGMPEVEISLYPDQGNRRIVEIQLQYDRPVEELQELSLQTIAAAERITSPLQGSTSPPEQLLTGLLLRLSNSLRCRENPGGSLPAGTAWDALVGMGGDAEGVALAFQLLCEQLKLDCSITEGTLDGADHLWNRVSLGDGKECYVDLSRTGLPRMFTGEELVQLGYVWGDALTGTAVSAASHPETEI